MRHIQVATHDDGLLGIETQQIGTEIVLPLHAIVQSAQLVLRVGSVASDQEEVGHLKGDDTPLMVVLVDANAVAHAQGLMARVDGCSRIAFLLGIVPIRLVTWELQVELPFLHLRLLQTEEVGIERLELLAEPFALASAQAIDIPRNKPHLRCR